MRSRVLSTVSVSIIMLAIASLLLVLLDRPDPAPANIASEIQTCRASTLRFVTFKSPNIRDADEVSNHCIGEVKNIHALTDFDIRRQAFSEQYKESKFILWLVVCLTISGVVLAAFQLMAGLELGERNISGADLTIGAGELSIKSTVTGLIILALSLAFFMIFVIYVYPVRQLSTASDTAVRPPQSSQNAPNAGANSPDNTFKSWALVLIINIIGLHRQMYPHMQIKRLNIPISLSFF